ncbi:CYP63 cytochrome P450 monooxygenase-like protein [Gymnopilus junonius]|uniref:CYP63 cytochrome P450 monooxygenase-like protein n=1 Tax=Gymnopilus junonius TaxID=109634 RepID=A0A9P5TJX2_GYMJU|nr:CYP63 cytochrome P450 monooxygenase-like protein [Gymnopilus junonius]
MVLTTPGIDLLAKTFTVLHGFIWILLSINSIVTSRFGYNIPTWIVLAGTAISIPLFSTIYIMSIKVKNWRNAAALGARPVPEAQGKLIGNLDILKEMMDKQQTGYPGDGLWELLEKRGPVANLRVLWSDLIFTASPEHIKTILATDFQNYVKGERFHYNMESVLGTGVFNSDGEMWKFHRSITRPMFTRERIGHFELFDRQAFQVVSKLKERLREGYAVDFQDLMSRFTLDSATEFLFGHNVQSLSAGLPYPHNASYVTVKHTPEGDAANSFARAFSEAQEVISIRERYGWVWPLMEMSKDKSYEPMQVVSAYIEPIVKEALAKKQSDVAAQEKGEEGSDDETLLDHLVRVTSDPVVLKDEILNIMIAGRDTTASTLNFIIYFLSIYPDVLARLRDEIISKVGHTRRPDYDDIREMKFLRAVINETLRLYPIVPFNVRESINAATWVSDDPNGKPYYIPAGTKTAYSVFMMHRRKDLWGPDAEEFDPDRFLDDRLKKYLSKNPFIFLPFNAGPRICLGQQFAYNEMSFMLIRLLQSFSSMELDLSAAPPEATPPKEWAQASGRKAIEKLFPKMHLTLYTNGGLWVKMTESDIAN